MCVLSLAQVGTHIKEAAVTESCCTWIVRMNDSKMYYIVSNISLDFMCCNYKRNNNEVQTQAEICTVIMVMTGTLVGLEVK